MTTPRERVPASCAEPIDMAVLMDYWLAALPPAEEDASKTPDRPATAVETSFGRRLRWPKGSDHWRGRDRCKSSSSDPFLQHAVATGLRVRIRAASR